MTRSFRFLTALSAFALLTFASAPAQAQGIDGKVELINTGENVVANYNDPNSGFYVGYYGFEFKWGGYSGLGNQFDAWCVDFEHGVSLGADWKVDFNGLGSGDLSNTRLGNTGLDKYTKAAWLITQMEPANKSDWGTIHAGIWNIINDGGPADGSPGEPSGGDAVGWEGWAAQASVWLGNATGSQIANLRNQFSVMSHVNNSGVVVAPGGRQEFMVRTQIVPEPGTVLLLATGLIGLFVAVRRRERAQVESA